MSNPTSAGSATQLNAPPSKQAHMGTRVMRSSFVWILLVLVALVGIFTVITPAGSFLSWANGQSILADTATTLVLAAGLTPLIIGGGLDISVGSVMTLAAVVSVIVMRDVSTSGTSHAWLAIAAGIAAGLGTGVGWGLINAVLIAYVELSPFIVTLGSLGAALGVARLLSGGVDIGSIPAQFQTSIGVSTIAGIPTTFVIAATVALILGVGLGWSRFGEHTYILGSSEDAAFRSGFRVPRHKLVLYAICGLTAGIAGVLDVAHLEIADVASGHTTELLAALSGVFIGGASLYGGVGTMIGSVIGVFIPTVLRNGLTIAGYQVFWQDVVVGIILVGAVAFDQWRRGKHA